MRGRLLAAVLTVFASAAFAAQPVAKVQLPCESNSQALSPTGAQLAVACKDHSLHLVEIPEGTERALAPAEPRVSDFAFSPDGSWLALGFGNGDVQLVSTHDAAASKHWNTGTRRIDGLYFLPDATAVFVVPVDSPGQVWEFAEAPRRVASLPVDFGGITASAASPDGKLLVTAGGDTVLRWYDTTTWKQTHEHRGFLLETFALAFTPDGKHVVAGGADSRLTLFDAASAKQVRQLPPDAGSYIVDIEFLGRTQRAATIYLDDAGGKPPHGVVWDLANTKSANISPDGTPTCAGVVGTKLWGCRTEGKTLIISQYE